MPFINSNHNKRPSRSRITVRGSGSKEKIPLAKGGKIPAGDYRSKILSIKSVKTAAGDEAIEVIYLLTAPDGTQMKMREIIPIESHAFEHFCDALLAAGLSENDDILDGIGTEEAVTLYYEDPHGFGRFSKRRPAAEEAAVDKHKPAKATASSKKIALDDDFEDFADFEEDSYT